MDSYELLEKKLEKKRAELQKPEFMSSSIDKIPIHRFLIVQGHEFQNYSPQAVKPVVKSFKTTQKDLIEQNLIKWLL